MHRLNKKFWIIICCLCFSLAFVFWPLPYYIEYPGAAENVAKYVKIEHKKAQTKGQFMLVYVSLLQATPATLLASYFQPYHEIEAKEDVLGNNNTAEYNQVQEYYMEDAINQAKYVALKLAHKPVEQTYLGMYVMSVASTSNFKDKLQVGDIITKINGVHYQNSPAFIRAVSKMAPNTQVKLTILRDGHEKNLTGKTKKITKKRVGIGITLADRSEIKTSIPIEANLADIGGPSAGLMLTLQMYMQLTKANLTQGNKIAGTGTIDKDGNVGDIGGIDKKVVASAKAGAKIFFAPNNPVSKAEKKIDPAALSNYQEAKKTAKAIGTKMKIVPVRTIEDALVYLQNNN